MRDFNLLTFYFGLSLVVQFDLDVDAFACQCANMCGFFACFFEADPPVAIAIKFRQAVLALKDRLNAS